MLEAAGLDLNPAFACVGRRALTDGLLFVQEKDTVVLRPADFAPFDGHLSHSGRYFLRSLAPASTSDWDGVDLKTGVSNRLACPDGIPPMALVEHGEKLFWVMQNTKDRDVRFFGFATA